MDDHGQASPPSSNVVLKDPVCGMPVTEQPEHREQFEARKYFFCSSKCQNVFKVDPKKYAISSAASELSLPSAAEIGSIYTCPMHPEIRQGYPGSCPKCGMTLEPVLPELEEDENPELRDYQRRFWWSLPLTVIAFALAMFGESWGLMDMAAQSWVEMFIAIPIVLWAGRPFFVRGWQSVLHRSPNMWTLIGLGTGAAFLYSVVATIAPQVFPDSFISMGRVAVYFEAAAVIISLTLLGQVLELKARSQTR